jgi:hypothetical protein
MSVTLPEVLAGAAPPGIYHLRSRAQPDSIAQSAARRGWRCFYLDGRQIGDKRALMAAAARALELPSYFGHNWDALEECLNDLAWAPAAGYLLLYDDAAQLARAEPEDWATLHAILADAVAAWAARGTPMYVLLRRAPRG